MSDWILIVGAVPFFLVLAILAYDRIAQIRKLER